ncbi:hypothetical protein Tco_1072234 [Tanacetum coccineum]
MKHTGVASWFVRLCNAQNDFVASDRIVWVDIEGVPLHAWSHATFHKIGSQWGEVMELEDGNEDLFARKRLCIKTKHANNILDSFKIIVKGKVFQIRAKELFVGTVFKEVPEGGEESDSEAVSDTFFGDNGDAQDHDNEVDQTLNDKEVSKDPFNIYDLLNRHKKEVGNSGMESSIPYPPGFTPEKLMLLLNKKFKEKNKNGRVIRDIRKEEVYIDILDEMIMDEEQKFAKAVWGDVEEKQISSFQFSSGLKQGDPLAPFLFILIMESLHLSFNRAVEAGIFTGLRIDDALTISHLFYADDAIFIGEWSKENLKGPEVSSYKIGNLRRNFFNGMQEGGSERLRG